MLMMFHPALWFLPLLTMMGGPRVKVNENVISYKNTAAVYVQRYNSAKGDIQKLQTHALEAFPNGQLNLFGPKMYFNLH